MAGAQGSTGAEVAARRWWWWAFVAVTVVHLGGQLAGVASVHVATKPALMPLLLAWFLTVAAPGPLRTAIAIALGLSWVGDVALLGDGEAWFLAGLGAFLLAQSTYAVAFLPWRASSVLARRRLGLVAYGAVLVGLLWLLWPHLGDLRVPVVVYAVVIVAMAVLATGLGAVAAIGAALFVVSDSLIALTSLTDLVAVPAPGFAIMLTYTVGQALLARGAAARTTAVGH